MEDRFVLKYWLISGEDLAQGARVAYFGRPAAPGKKNPSAVRVLTVDVPIQGQISVVPEGRDYVFVEVRDADRRPHAGLIYCPKPDERIKTGDWLSVTPTIDRSGRLALRLQA
jgi:hypothetical protein